MAKSKPADKATVTRKQRLKRVKANNFMRLKTVEFSPKNGIIVICGNNDQGKTSLAKFIRTVFGGKYELPDMPVLDGEKKASGEIETTDFLWKWEYDPAKSNPNTLTVLDKARAKNVKGPQGFTKRMFGEFALDLMRFHDLEPRQQLEYAQSVMLDKDGNQIDLEEYNNTYKEFYDDRAEKRAAMKAAAAVLDKNPLVPDAPDAPIDVTELSKKIEEATEHNRTVEDIKRKADDSTKAVAQAESNVAELEAKLAAAKKGLKAIKAMDVAIQAKASNVKTHDVEPLKAERDNAGTVNELFNKQKAHNEARENHERYQKAFDNVQEALDKHVEEHKQRMADMNWPVESLEWKDDRFQYKGIPLSQNSTRNKIFVAWQLAMAENPDMPIALIDDANVLDNDSRAYFEELSSKYETDTLMFYVGEDVEGAQMTIRAGEAVK